MAKNLTLTLEEALKRIQKGEPVEFIEFIGSGLLSQTVSSMDGFEKYKTENKGHTVKAFESYTDYQYLNDFGNGGFVSHSIKL